MERSIQAANWMKHAEKTSRATYNIEQDKQSAGGVAVKLKRLARGKDYCAKLDSMTYWNATPEERDEIRRKSNKTSIAT
jgi:hypothetical protein